MKRLFLILALIPIAEARADEVVRLFPGFVTKLRCEGRLLLSSVGDDRLVRLEALPNGLGCGVVLKPIGASGRTNLILETSTGSVRRMLVIAGGGSMPGSSDLSIQAKGVQE